MTTNTPCPDCIGLVGAAKTKEPHHRLLPLMKDSSRENEFECEDCHCHWAVNVLGWARLVD